MSGSNPKSAFWSGFRNGAPFVLVVVPFALLFGVVATRAGLNLVETMAMTVLVIAGAAQFTALSLLQEHAPTFIVLATALAVNLRMAMYSAALVPHIGGAPRWLRMLMAYFLVDQVFAVSIARFEQPPAMSQAERIAYYFGAASPIVPLWYLFSWVGAVAGKAIPPQYALDFAVPITFIALVAPMLRSLPHVSAALVSVVAALALAGLPFNLGLIVAALLAMIAGAWVESWQTRRAASGPEARPR